MKFHSFHGNPSWVLKNEGVWGSANEQFGAHEKLSWVGGSRGVQGTLNWPPGNTIHVNLRKHDLIDLICNFIHIYQSRVRLLLPYI